MFPQSISFVFIAGKLKTGLLDFLLLIDDKSMFVLTVRSVYSTCQGQRSRTNEICSID